MFYKLLGFDSLGIVLRWALEKGVLPYWVHFKSYWEGRGTVKLYSVRCLLNEQHDPGRTDQKLELFYKETWGQICSLGIH